MVVNWEENNDSVYLTIIMSELSVNNLLGIKHLNTDDLKLIFKTADNFKEVINRKIKKFHH